MNDDLGKLILRLTLAATLLLHGVAKMISGVGPIAGMLGTAGLPTQLAYAVFIGEVLAPILIVIGVWTRMAAMVVVINMIVAVALVHSGDFLKITSTGGWALELQAFYLFVALAIVLLGAGRYSMGGTKGRWN
ncbi:DoxX family protein [Lacisediminimonas sp.]|uniref:DoxX family protein n=1 Tax=Lacisediminimonas sp. TaxID=3060582 RepID=UPI00271DC9EE|nr:DoxX family protein [Lacisediminimonas sp.]MDO8301032.1 DoxX family protein [Lacisediminimonas sp.]